MSAGLASLSASAPWLRFLAIYAAYSIVAHLAWESAQLPLYTLWQTAAFDYLAFAVIHCAVGDLLIAQASLLSAIAVTRNSTWPPAHFARLIAVAVAFGVAYTAYSEWQNVYVQKTWAYADAMPALLGIGVSPLAQWLIIPPIGLAWTRRLMGETP